jgi:hypothetical protein
MEKLMKKAVYVVFALGLSLTACKKDSLADLFDSEASEDENNVSMVEEDNTMANDFVLSENIGGRIEDGGRTEGGRFLGSATTTFDPATQTITIDFGTTNVQCADGRMRRGKILIKINEGRPNQLPFSTTTTHENYFVNDNKVEGTRNQRTVGTLTNRTTTIAANRTVTFTDSRTATRTVNHVRTAVREGLTDWTYSTTGTANGTTRKGRTYNNTITLPLISKTTCQNQLFPIAGTISMSVNGFDTPFILDFGSGTCDKTFTISYNGRTKTITR